MEIGWTHISTTVAAKIRTHILTTQPSEQKSDALNRSTMALTFLNVCVTHQLKGFNSTTTLFESMMKYLPHLA